MPFPERGGKKKKIISEGRVWKLLPSSKDGYTAAVDSCRVCVCVGGGVLFSLDVLRSKH